jgi:hypothetical protein
MKMNITNKKEFFVFKVETKIPAFGYRAGVGIHKDKFSLFIEESAPHEKWREVYLIEMFEWGRADGSFVKLGDWAVSCLINYRHGLVGALNYYQENLLTG